MSTQTFYRTTELAALVGIHPRTLYTWLAQGLLPEPRRIVRGRASARLFTPNDLERARRVKRDNHLFRGGS